MSQGVTDSGFIGQDIYIKQVRFDIFVNTTSTTAYDTVRFLIAACPRGRNLNSSSGLTINSVVDSHTFADCLVKYVDKKVLVGPIGGGTIPTYVRMRGVANINARERYDSGNNLGGIWNLGCYILGQYSSGSSLTEVNSGSLEITYVDV